MRIIALALQIRITVRIEKCTICHSKSKLVPRELTAGFHQRALAVFAGAVEIEDMRTTPKEELARKL